MNCGGTAMSDKHRALGLTSFGVRVLALEHSAQGS